MSQREEWVREEAERALGEPVECVVIDEVRNTPEGTFIKASARLAPRAEGVMLTINEPTWGVGWPD